MTGDVGANLYSIEAVNRGEVPYRDFLWVYGPLMLYYHALFFKLLGSSIQSALWARLLLETIFAGVFFLGARRIMHPFAALLATSAFSVFRPEFTSTVVHYGGVCMEIGILWAVLSYCRKPKNKYVLSGAAFVLSLGFIKLNFGIFFLPAIFLGFILCDYLQHKNLSAQRLKRYGLYFIGIIAIWFSIYYLFVQPLTWQQLNQCFPVLKDYIYPGGGIIRGLTNLVNVTFDNIQSNQNFESLIARLGFVSLIICVISMIMHRRTTVEPARNFFLINALILILALCSYHEFIRSTLDYQAFWAKPFVIMIIAYVIAEACAVSHVVIAVFVSLTVAAILFVQTSRAINHLESVKRPEYFFASKHMNIYITEAPKDIKSMLDTVNYIDTNIPPDQMFFTFPLNAGYYYLTDRRSPDWLLQLLEVNKVSPEQEIEIIRNLERQGVEYIVLPSIAYAGFGHFGKFGTTHGQLLAKYFREYFEEVARFGEWSEVSDEDYVGGMGTKILKKKVAQSIDIRTAADLDQFTGSK